MKLNLGHLPADRITDADLLKDIADQLPEPMRSLCIDLNYHADPNTPEYLVSLDRSLPDVLRRRFRYGEVRRMGVSVRALKYHLIPDGHDDQGRWWYYATITQYVKRRK